jgi:putative transposase
MGKKRFGGRFNVFWVIYVFLAHRFMPKHDGQIQLLLYQIKMLRDRIDDPRIIPSSDERAELLRLGAEIDHDIAEIMKVVKLGTYRRWRNKKAEKTEKEKTAGRPETPEETVKLVIQLATENIAWGYKRILGELKRLGVEIGLTTIRDILKRAGHKPSPQKTKSKPVVPWSDFVAAHMETLIACDYFTKPIYTLFGKFDAYVLVFIHLDSRRVFMTPPTFNPDDQWLKIQIRSAVMWLDGIGVKPKLLIHDGDKKFGRMFKAFWKSEGVRCLKIPPRSPQANAFCECYIGTYKHQCLNSFFCLSLDQLDYINRQWVTYYNNERPHQGKDIGNNILRPAFTPNSEGKIVRHESLGGVLAWYERDAA